MLQDLETGRLENEYRNLTPTEDDVIVCFQNNTVLLHYREDRTILLPTAKHFPDIRQSTVHYVFHHLGKNWFIRMEEGAACADPAFGYENLRQTYRSASRSVSYGIMTAWHLYNWYRNNRRCGRCGTPTQHDSVERMLRCPNCGNMIFPRISPAVIVAVTDGDRILLTKYAGRIGAHYALIAGFTEIGETLEQTVHREVMEETGLRVKNLRYYKSQPWGIDGNILAGFYCDLDGDDTIHLDEKELSLAQWYSRDALPTKDDGISLTQEMIRVFGSGMEPKA